MVSIKIRLQKKKLRKNKIGLHVISDGKILHGLPAFRAIWTLMPRYKLLAIVTNIPVIREIATFTYDKILAPILYKSHLRRQAKKARQT